MKLDDTVDTIPFIKENYQEKLERLGIQSIKDILFYFPRTYTDTSKIFSFDELSDVEKRTTAGTLLEIKSMRTRSRVTIQRAKFESGGAVLPVTWFNQPYLEKSLKVGEDYLIFGKLNSKSTKKEMLSPIVEELDFNKETTNLGRIAPVYPLTEGVKPKWLRARIKWLVDHINYIVDLQENLDPQLIEKFNLYGIIQSVSQIHFPEDAKTFESAKLRLGFDEMLKIQMKIEKQRRKRLKYKAMPVNPGGLDSFYKNLEFELTKDQQNVIKECVEDVSKDSPMLRLLQGDVGSGKTVVAASIAYINYLSGYKTIYLAPTTILANQIHQTFKKFIKNADIHLLTGTSKIESEVKENAIIIGTHALLFQSEELFSNMNLLIIDEEHRFGVKQREALTKIEDIYKPHKLTMTATPIPRSLAMAIWGDSDVSVIKSKPKKRKETKSYFVPNNKKPDSYKWLKEKIKTEKTQIFWVCPLIYESDVLNAESAEKVFKEVKKEFKDFRVILVHGKTKDKEEILTQFKNGDYDILVTTPIIEVGIDIPNANIIIIESCERFGLAQLHQLRGRVGRGDQEGNCLLFSNEELNQDQKARIKFFCENNDGLQLAEFDLKRRGPGEVYGTKQSGIPELKIANIFDNDLIKMSREAAVMIIDNKLKFTPIF